MNFELSEDQMLFKASIERFAGGRDVEQRKAARRLPGGVDPARWAELAELGLLALPLAEAEGGLGADPVDCCIAAIALGGALAIEPWLECAYWPLRLLDGAEGGAAFAGQVAMGDLRVGVAFAEPAARFDHKPRATRASRSPSGGWILDGAKTFVLAGEAADHFLVTAATDDGTGLFALPASAVEVRGYALVDGGRAATINVHEAQVPADAWLGEVSGSLDAAVAETILIAAAEIVGIAGRLFDDTLAYARERCQFGQAIGSFQAVQHRLVDCYVMLEQMRSLLWHAALTERDEVGQWRSTIAGAKAFIAERALHIGHEAIQLHGAMGMSDELAIGHGHKRVLLLSRLFGDPATALGDLARAA